MAAKTLLYDFPLAYHPGKARLALMEVRVARQKPHACAAAKHVPLL
jgi:hypothetical protein